MHWASVSGVARVIEDRSVIKKYWSSGYVPVTAILRPRTNEGRRLQNNLTFFFLYSIGSYFGDLGDGIHKGDANDPRVAAIEVVPDEIRYWLASSLPVSYQEMASTVKCKVDIPGELRTITSKEVSALESDTRWT